MDERIRQYNAAGRALADAANALRTAPDEGLAQAEADFRNAQAEFERCKKNLELAEEARGAATFAPKPVDNPNLIGMDQKEVRAYSVVRAIRAVALNDWKGAELERDASQEIAKRVGKEPQGFFVPYDVQVETRAGMDTATTGAGKEMVATELLAGSFISMLRKRMALRRAGATYLTGLTGNIAIPRQTGSGTFYWIDATTNTEITGESHPAVDQVTMTPKTGAAYSQVGRTLIMQASPDVENLVRIDLATIAALGVDAAGLYGTGTDQQPKGIALQTGVNVVALGTDGAAPTWAKIVQMETEVAADDADVESMAYLVNARTRGFLKSTPKVATYSAEMMWDTRSPDTPLNGYPAVVSNQVRNNLTKASGTGLSELFFGNFADCLIGQWGTLDIFADPYSDSKKGIINLIVFQDVDVAVRHGESFSRIADAVVS
jgi:HK97 family phage major capsid protein